MKRQPDGSEVMSPHEPQCQLNGDPFFRVLAQPAPTRHDLEELAAGVCGVLHVPGVLAESQCEKFMYSLDSAMMDHYDPARYELAIGRFGPVLNEFSGGDGLSADYWRLSARAESYWSTIKGAADIRSACRRFLSDAWGTGVETAAIEHRDLFWGIVREANAGTLIHWDEVVREYPSTPLQEVPVAQLACNVFVSVPESGGETSVWRHRWQPEDEQHRFRFGYHAAAVAPHSQIMVKPRLGDAVFFDSRNFHRAEAGTGGRRVSLSFFLGVTTSGRLLIWS